MRDNKKRKTTTQVNEKLSAHMEDLIPLICERINAGQSVRFSPRGISMLPMIRPGIDTVTLSPMPERLKKYDIPLYQRSNGKYVLHRVIKTGETYSCMGDNQFIIEKNLRHSQMIAVVTAFSRGENEYSVNVWHHRLYCRFWHYSRFFRRLWRALIRRIRKFNEVER